MSTVSRWEEMLPDLLTQYRCNKQARYEEQRRAWLARIEKHDYREKADA
jgi:hypothetical protein